MIRKLRWKVVGLNMLFVAVILLVIFVGVFFSTRSHLLHGMEIQLHQALEGGTKLPPPDENTWPCFVAEVFPSGTVRLSGNHYYQIYSDDEIASIVQDCLSKPDSSGILRAYHLHYLRSTTPLYTRIAFTDSTFEQTVLRPLILTLSLIMLSALAAFFGCSYVLSGLVTRPVEQTWEGQKRFLSDASHELKTPLTVILSSADLLAEELPDEGQHYLDNIRVESLRMKSLVEDMLTLSRNEEQGQQIPLAPLDLSDLVMDSVLRFEPVAYEAQRHLSYDIVPELRTIGLSEQLSRLVVVLLDNAIKYAPCGSTISLSLRREGENARLLVENGGDPIPPEKLSHLFERFYRAGDSRGEVVGFGLGLPIAKSIVKQHGGKIHCESDSRSTRFYVTLPLIG